MVTWALASCHCYSEQKRQIGCCTHFEQAGPEFGAHCPIWLDPASFVVAFVFLFCVFFVPLFPPVLL